MRSAQHGQHLQQQQQQQRQPSRSRIASNCISESASRKANFTPIVAFVAGPIIRDATPLQTWTWTWTWTRSRDRFPKARSSIVCSNYACFPVCLSLSDCLSLSGIVGAFMAPHTPAIKQFAWQQLLLLQLRQQQCRLLAKLSGQASRQFGHSWSMESRQVASDKNVAIVRLLVVAAFVVASIVAAVAVSIVVAAVVACYCQRFVIMHIIVGAAVVVAAALHAVVPAACWAIKEALPYSHTATEKVQQQQPVTCNNNNDCYCNRQQHSQTSCRRRH